MRSKRCTVQNQGITLNAFWLSKMKKKNVEKLVEQTIQALKPC